MAALEGGTPAPPPLQALTESRISNFFLAWRTLICHGRNEQVKGDRLRQPLACAWPESTQAACASLRPPACLQLPEPGPAPPSHGPGVLPQARTLGPSRGQSRAFSPCWETLQMLLNEVRGLCPCGPRPRARPQPTLTSGLLPGHPNHVPSRELASEAFSIQRSCSRHKLHLSAGSPLWPPAVSQDPTQHAQWPTWST